MEPQCFLLCCIIPDGHRVMLADLPDTSETPSYSGPLPGQQPLLRSFPFAHFASGRLSLCDYVIPIQKPLATDRGDPGAAEQREEEFQVLWQGRHDEGQVDLTLGSCRRFHRGRLTRIQRGLTAILLSQPRHRQPALGLYFHRLVQSSTVLMWCHCDPQ